MNLRKYILLIFSLLTVSGLFGQLSMRIEDIYQLIKRESIHRKKADWAEIDQAFYAGLKAAKSTNDSMRCFVQVFKALGDVHSSVIFQGSTFAHFNPVDEATFDRLIPLLNRSNEELGRVRTGLLQKKYVYIQVPGFFATPDMVDSLARTISDSLCQYAGIKARGVIVDLRMNKGGNLYPMLSGLGSLLGDGPIGGETGVDGQTLRSWVIQNGNFIQAGVPMSDIQHSCGTAFAKTPVVVLTGPITISSGAMVAIAFKGRSKTRLIGEPTGEGYTTSNGWFQLGPRSALNLAGAFVSDRQGKVYDNNVTPDEIITGSPHFGNLEKDAQVAAALKWLKK